MTDIQRYQIPRGVTISLLPDGEFVKYEDHMKVVEGLEEVNKPITEVCLQGQIDLRDAEIAELQARIEELEAINEGHEAHIKHLNKQVKDVKWRDNQIKAEGIEEMLKRANYLRHFDEMFIGKTQVLDYIKKLREKE